MRTLARDISVQLNGVRMKNSGNLTEELHTAMNQHKSNCVYLLCFCCCCVLWCMFGVFVCDGEMHVWYMHVRPVEGVRCFPLLLSTALGQKVRSSLFQLGWLNSKLPGSVCL